MSDHMNQTIKTINKYGEDLPARKRSKATRIVFQNINGIPRTKDKIHAAEIGIINKEREVDIFMFAEHNTNTQYKNTQLHIKQQIQHNIKNVHLATNSTPAKGIQARGGTGILTANQWVRRITKQEETDELGRWTAITIKGKQQKQITLISAYNPCQQDGNS